VSLWATSDTSIAGSRNGASASDRTGPSAFDQVITPFIERIYKKRNVESWQDAASRLQRLSGFLVNDRRLGDWGARKTKKARSIPISDRLAAVLDMRRTNVAGEVCEGTAYVFGDEIGAPTKSIKKAWETSVLKAHGYVPEWRRTGNSNALSSESRAHLRMIDVHFHDLRHEGGIRLLEKGWQLHWLQKMYGHATLAQTSKYLHADEFVLPDVMRQFERQIDETWCSRGAKGPNRSPASAPCKTYRGS
jgi:Phage integrase family